MDNLKSITLIDGLVFHAGGMDRPRGWPTGKTPPASATDLVWTEDSETGDITVTFLSAPEAEDGEQVETAVTITADEIQTAWDTPPAATPPPLTERLKAFLDSQPVAVRAAYEPLRRPVWDAIARGDIEVAKFLIEQAVVPAELESQRQAMLNEFSG